jgi:hypothetical protein
LSDLSQNGSCVKIIGPGPDPQEFTLTFDGEFLFKYGPERDIEIINIFWHILAIQPDVFYVKDNPLITISSGNHSDGTGGSSVEITDGKFKTIGCVDTERSNAFWSAIADNYSQFIDTLLTKDVVDA